MNQLSQSWKNDHGPISSGLFFPDQTWRAAVYNDKHSSLSIGELRALSPDIEYAEYGDYENGRFTCEAGIVRWGGGPWEGEGWLALEDHASNLKWLLHLENSEPFTQARYHTGKIEAVAYEYPAMTVFLIPVADAHLATCRREPT